MVLFGALPVSRGGKCEVEGSKQTNALLSGESYNKIETFE